MARDKGTGSVYYDASRGIWRGSIEAGWTKRGTRRRVKVSAPTKRECLAKLKARAREIAQAGVPDEASRAVTVKAWMTEWLEVDSHRSRPSAHTANKSAASQWIIPTLGTVKLANVSPAHVRKLARVMLDDGRAASSARRTQAVFVKALKDALLEGHPVPHAALETELTPVGESDRDAIPLDHALRILAVALTRDDATRWVAALLQGIRPAEALGLRWSSLDLTAGTMDTSWQLKALPYQVKRRRTSGFRVPDGYETIQIEGRWHLARPKTAAGRRVHPVPPGVVAMLEAWRGKAPKSKHGLVWPNESGGPRDDKDDRAAWAAICEEAEVARTLEDGTTRPYALYEARHTAATLLRVIGADDETITALLGHASILSTKAYLHTDQTRTREALEAVAKVLQIES